MGVEEERCLLPAETGSALTARLRAMAKVRGTGATRGLARHVCINVDDIQVQWMVGLYVVCACPYARTRLRKHGNYLKLTLFICPCMRFVSSSSPPPIRTPAPRQSVASLFLCVRGGVSASTSRRKSKRLGGNVYTADC